MSRHPYWTLYQKELRGQRQAALILALAAVAWDVFLSTRFGDWRAELIFGLSGLALFLIPVAALWQGYGTLRSEYALNTAYLLLALPIADWRKLAIKLAAVLSLLAALAVLVAAGSAFILALHLGPVLSNWGMGKAPSFGWLIFSAAKLLPYYVMAVVAVALVGQFGYLASRLVRRFGGWVGALAVTLAVVAGIRFMIWAQPLAGRLPPLVFGAWEKPMPDSVDYVTLTTGPLLSGAIIILALFCANALLWSRRGEV